ncbi:Transcription elongation protein NusA [Candidatus Portiera aleyrodidarum]|uniref:Transcription termination/antitermination protein NusA n=1 Tax=Candidatus Portiera aleyrodidarum TaxID=91844 RepID=A0A6S6S1X6_9GAMM|nr:transcription termination factor NusA [Candidatus Portiera aleyrodidarum]CAA3708995.1 Transcription elongation protein NusA [Candidatus Portiera aleyrodidarum]
MMSKDILLNIDSIYNEKGVSRHCIFKAVEEALSGATIKRFEGQNVNIIVKMNRINGKYDTFRRWQVVKDETYTKSSIEIPYTAAKKINKKFEINKYIEYKIENINFCRIAVKIAKQIIVQKVREAEHTEIIRNYSNKIGEIICGNIKKIIKEGIIIELDDKTEGFLPWNQMIPGERFNINERIRTLLYKVIPYSRNFKLILSRCCSTFLIELLKREIPEILDELIEIKSVARDPGYKAKIAVKYNIDPITIGTGYCVGLDIRGSRIQSISNELHNERIDVILWDKNYKKFVINAFSPLDIISLNIDEINQKMEIVVKEHSYYKAIGKGGQNIKLTSELTGWMLNVVTKNEANKKNKSQVNFLSLKLDIAKKIAVLLVDYGFTSLEEIVYVPIKEFLKIKELKINVIKKLKSRAQDELLILAMKEEKTILEKYNVRNNC